MKITDLVKWFWKMGGSIPPATSDIDYDGSVCHPIIKDVTQEMNTKMTRTMVAEQFSDKLAFNPFDKTNDVYSGFAQDARKKFLDSFKQNHILCWNGNPRKKISSMNHDNGSNAVSLALEANVNNHSDVYFYINGGRKMYGIKAFTCCFCDMDAGRDSDGKYFKPSIVMTKKKKFLEKINNFPVRPSWVVDTRNGYQCYWIFDDESRKIVGNNKTFWNGLQKKLVNYFDGDPRAIKANQIYRVPYTWWRKEWEKKAPYFSSLLPGCTGQPVNVADLKAALTGQSAQLTIVPEKCSDEWYKGYAKAYKESDVTGVPVRSDVAEDILNNLRSIKQRTFGEPMPVKRYSNIIDDNGDELIDSPSEDLSLDGSQTKLLKTVVEYLNQASTALYFSNNRFLSSAAKDLAAQISDKFCIG